MPRRQIVVFRIGCYLALLMALVHMVGHVAGPQAPANDTERQLLDLATTYEYSVPGGARRTLMDFMNGFSLAYSTLLAAIGALGLVIAKRGQQDPLLMVGAARVIALSAAGLLLVSLTQFFIVPTIFTAAILVPFAVASVRPPAA